MLEVLKAAKKALEAVFFKMVMMIIIIELISPSYMTVAYLIIKNKTTTKKDEKMQLWLPSGSRDRQISLEKRSGCRYVYIQWILPFRGYDDLYSFLQK